MKEPRLGLKKPLISFVIRYIIKLEINKMFYKNKCAKQMCQTRRPK